MICNFKMSRSLKCQTIHLADMLKLLCNKVTDLQEASCWLIALATLFSTVFTCINTYPALMNCVRDMSSDYPPSWGWLWLKSPVCLILLFKTELVKTLFSSTERSSAAAKHHGKAVTSLFLNHTLPVTKETFYQDTITVSCLTKQPCMSRLYC